MDYFSYLYNKINCFKHIYAFIIVIYSIVWLIWIISLIEINLIVLCKMNLFSFNTISNLGIILQMMQNSEILYSEKRIGNIPGW